MLDGLRSFSKTWIAKILLALLVVSFAAFGINNVITDLGSSTIARVGDEDISARDFQRMYQSQLNAAAQQIGMLPTAEQAMALGIPSSVIGRLGADAALDKLGRDFNIGASDDRLAIMLRNDPNFSGTLGAFNADNFRRVLQASGYTETEYFNQQTKAARRQQIGVALLGDAIVPTTAQDILNRYGSDRRTVDYFVVNDTSIPPVAEPTDEELAAYLSEHQADFRTVETRTVDVLTLSLNSLAATKTISDEAVAAEYERTKASLTTPERRTIRQLPLSAEALPQFEAGLAAGTPFDTLVATAGLTPTELGDLARSQVNDAALADAAFGIGAAGQFVIIDGIGGKRAVQVSQITPSGETSLADATPTLRQNLALTEARNEYSEVLDQVEELRAAFTPLTDIATRYNLTVESRSVTAGGSELEGIGDIPEAERGRVATAIFSAEHGRLSPAVALASNNNVWFDLKSTEPARDRTLEEARDEVAAAWTGEQTNEAITAEVERLVGQLETGTAFADVAVGANQFPQLSQPMTRSGDGTPTLDASVAGAIFAGGEGHFGSAINGEGDHVVFQVVEILPASDPINPQTADAVAGSMRDDLYGQFVLGLRDDAGLRVNQQALNQQLTLMGQGQIGN